MLPILFFFIFFLILWTYKKMFSKKIIVLLSLEGFILSVVIIYLLTLSLSFSSMLSFIMLSVFMVLDSVFGITLLTSSSRLTNTNSKILS